MFQFNARPGVVREEHEVNQALRELGLTREIVRRIALAAASARNEALPVDPSCSPGMLSYIHGVRETRLALLPLGWEVSRDGNVELTVNMARGLQVGFQNVDVACGLQDPEAVSGKGAASRRLVNSGQGEFDFVGGSYIAPKADKFNPVMWFICVSANDESVCAEVSCPRQFEGSSFDGFVHRILVMDESFTPDPNEGREADDGDIDLDIPVSKKL